MPDGETIQRRRRAASCEPSNEKPKTKLSDSPRSKGERRTSRKIGRPCLPHGETAPASIDRSSDISSSPVTKLVGLEISDGEETDNSSDEGYESYINRERRNREAEKRMLKDFVVHDQPSEDDSDGTYEPSSSEEDSSETYSTEEDNSAEGSDVQGDASDTYELSDDESHGHGTFRQSHNWPTVHCTPPRAYRHPNQTEDYSKIYR